LLAFKVVPTRRKNDSIPAEAYQKALVGEARNTVLGPKANELRFARVEDAEEAVKRLRKTLPTSSWAIAQETPRES
jgi:hypothetical protein